MTVKETLREIVNYIASREGWRFKRFERCPGGGTYALFKSGQDEICLLFEKNRHGEWVYCAEWRNGVEQYYRLAPID